MDNINRIMISRMRFIGDIILTTPVIRAVREKYPQAYIAYLGEREAVTLLRKNPYLDEIIPYDFSAPSISEQVRAILGIREKKIDLFIDLFSNPRSALLARFSGAHIRIGKDVRWRGKWYTHRIKDDGKVKTAIQFHYQYLEPLGIEADYWKTEIFITDEERKTAEKILDSYHLDTSKPVIGIHPGATWPAKIWPAENFIELANRLSQDLKYQVIFTRGPGEEALFKKITEDVSPSVKILEVMPLRTLSAVLSHLAIYISNDCGPMHISVAVGTKTIAIFGPGQEEIWFPYRPPFYPADCGHLALRKDVPCHPCHLNVCNRSGNGFMECMRLLNPEEVIREVKKLI